MALARNQRIALLAAPLASAALLYAGLVDRLLGALARLEAPELSTSGAALAFVLPAVAALLGWIAGGFGEDRRRNGRVIASTVAAGALGGLVAAAVPIVGNLVRLGGGVRAEDAAQLGYLIPGAAAGALLGLPASLVVLFVLGLARRAAGSDRAAFNAKLLLAGAAALAFTQGLYLFKPRLFPPPEAVVARAPEAEGKRRGLSPEEESAFLRKRRLVDKLVNDIEAALVPGKAHDIEVAILEAEAQDVLRDTFETAIERGLYKRMEQRFRELPRDSDALRALADARPDYGVDTLNADAVADIEGRKDWSQYVYSVLIVPGYTPLNTRKPLAVDEIPAAKKRCDLAYDDWKRGLAPYILVSGGAVHPSGTPHNEALSMRDYLLKRGVPPERLLVDPFARHSTTNLRNAGRMMRKHGLPRAVIVTGFESSPFDQAFYYAYPVISTFASRSRRELGYQVGELRRLDEHHVEFQPAAEVALVNPYDPLDA